MQERCPACNVERAYADASDPTKCGRNSTGFLFRFLYERIGAAILFCIASLFVIDVLFDFRTILFCVVFFFVVAFLFAGTPTIRTCCQCGKKRGWAGFERAACRQCKHREAVGQMSSRGAHGLGRSSGVVVGSRTAGS